MIPEGIYLEMCDNLKQVHHNLPQNDDPPVTDNRRPTPVNVPFQVVMPGFTSEWNDEWVQNERSLRRLTVDLKITEKSLRKLKYIGNITKKVKEDAIRDFCDGDRECVDGGEWTIENLNAATTWSSEEERRECTTKVYERTLYQNYKTRINRQVERFRGQAMELKRNLEDEIEDFRDRQNYLRVHYNL
tara:strand:- start:86 stop:649 length:564 start_codon:yes stop_codon:yes gene_type:complete